MRRHTVAAVAVFGGAALAACTSPPQTPLASTASVTVNGVKATFDVVTCTQVQWYRTIHIGHKLSGATVVVDGRAAKAVAESARINNVGGFTGMYSQGGGDAAETRFDGSTYLITGVAAGSSTANPTEPATAEFKISAKC
ncbi:hypothetical protein A5645_05155 [Mycobacterium asiaticum]|uniref:lipoprotein LpqH n=1 Tax=Mycobacterium asiaticum TaxID=1790 RepID=UPI0007EF2172|nr:lipoprotein LpqH [Mycobacterium asiaticum]OBK97953.1 hypothetical protein A5645_05155 [Mycobacterium asiaticum]